jgi:hypothetical protein
MSKAKKGSPDVEEARLRQQAIGVRLRQIFDDVVNEPVPDDFLEILRGATPDSESLGSELGERKPGDKPQ